MLNFKDKLYRGYSRLSFVSCEYYGDEVLYDIWGVKTEEISSCFTHYRCTAKTKAVAIWCEEKSVSSIGP